MELIILDDGLYQLIPVTKQMMEHISLLELIILDDGLYQLIPVTKQMMEHISLSVDCMGICDILRAKLSGYADTLNLHIMNDGSGSFVGCICN
jgi:hypothetical protein